MSTAGAARVYHREPTGGRRGPRRCRSGTVSCVGVPSASRCATTVQLPVAGTANSAIGPIATVVRARSADFDVRQRLAGEGAEVLHLTGSEAGEHDRAVDRHVDGDAGNSVEQHHADRGACAEDEPAGTARSAAASARQLKRGLFFIVGPFGSQHMIPTVGGPTALRRMRMKVFVLNAPMGQNQLPRRRQELRKSPPLRGPCAVRVDPLTFEDLLERLGRLLDRMLGEERLHVGDRCRVRSAASRRRPCARSCWSGSARWPRPSDRGRSPTLRRRGGGWRSPERSTNGAFCVFTASLIANSHVRRIRASSSNSVSAYRWRSCSCGVRPCGTGRASVRTPRRRRWPRRPIVAAAASSGSTVLASRLAASYQLAAAGLGAASPPSTPTAPTSSPRSLLVRSLSPAAGSPSSSSAGPTSARTRAWNASCDVVVDDPAEPSQRDDDRLPDRVVALGAEAVEERAGAPTRRGGRRASTTTRRRRGCSARAWSSTASTSPARRSRSSSE